MPRQSNTHRYTPNFKRRYAHYTYGILYTYVTYCLFLSRYTINPCFIPMFYLWYIYLVYPWYILRVITTSKCLHPLAALIIRLWTYLEQNIHKTGNTSKIHFKGGTLSVSLSEGNHPCHFRVRIRSLSVHVLDPVKYNVLWITHFVPIFLYSDTLTFIHLCVYAQAHTSQG